MKTSILQRKDFSQLLKNVGGNLSSLKQELTDYNTFTVAVADKDIKPQHFRYVGVSFCFSNKRLFLRLKCFLFPTGLDKTA